MECTCWFRFFNCVNTFPQIWQTGPRERNKFWYWEKWKLHFCSNPYTLKKHSSQCYCWCNLCFMLSHYNNWLNQHFLKILHISIWKKTLIDLNHIIFNTNYFTNDSLWYNKFMLVFTIWAIKINNGTPNSRCMNSSHISKNSRPLNLGQIWSKNFTI